jgi:hypothetical protein
MLAPRQITGRSGTVFESEGPVLRTIQTTSAAVPSALATAGAILLPQAVIHAAIVPPSSRPRRMVSRAM